jgi:hypothetical protein
MEIFIESLGNLVVISNSIIKMGEMCEFIIVSRAFQAPQRGWGVEGGTAFFQARARLDSWSPTAQFL